MKPKIFLSRDEWVTGLKLLTEGGQPPPPLRKLVNSEVKVGPIDPATGMNDISFVISTAAVDRESDIISVEGWELDNYKKNPVVLWAHDYYSPPIGRATEVKVDGDALVATDRFTPEDVNPFGAMIYRMVKGGFLKATSVGFQPIEWTYSEEHNGYDFLRNELLEHSVVPVPANPEALVMASAAGIDLRPMKEWVERYLDHDPEVQHFRAIPASLVERAKQELGNVGVTPSVTVTSGFCQTEDSGGNGGEWYGTTTTTVGNDTWTGDSTTWSPWYPDYYRTYDPNWWIREIEKTTTDEQEAEMEEAIKELIEEIRGLREDLVKMTDLLQKSPDDDDSTAVEDEMTADELRAVVRETVQEVMTATTGKLPE
jgi:HK97 family phage prohead protease